MKRLALSDVWKVGRSCRLLLFILLLLAGCTTQHLRPTRTQLDARDVRLKQTNLCVRISSPVKVDGVLDDTVWQSLPVITNFVQPVTWADPKIDIRARVAYDDTYLYVAFDVKDVDVQAPDFPRDGALYEGDVVEIFLKPTKRQNRYSEIEISPTGAILDATFWRKRHSPKFYAWTCEELLSAVRIDGTRNQSRDRDAGWSVELAIPFASLPDVGQAPEAGSSWRMNLAGYNYSRRLSGGHETFSNSPMCQNLFRRYEDWSWLRFE